VSSKDKNVHLYEVTAKSYKIIVVKPEGKRRLGRPRRRWEDNIKIIVKTGSESVDWIHLNEDRVQWQAPASTGIGLRVP
jgi:hypothetical protein